MNMKLPPVPRGWIVATALAAMCALGCMPGPVMAVDEPGEFSGGGSAAVQGDRQRAYLYFADTSSPFLTAEERSLPPADTAQAYAENIITGLIEGSKRGLVRTLPPETRLRALYILNDGTAYVDLTEGVRASPTGGVTAELLTVYAVVNALILNVPEIRSVSILIDGQQALTLTGHMDLRFPLKAEMLLVR